MHVNSKANAAAPKLFVHMSAGKWRLNMLQTPAGSIPMPPLALARGICAAGWDGDESAGVVVHAHGFPRLVCELRDARPTALHVHEHTLTVADDRGRVFVVDADRGEILQRVALPG